MHDDMAKKAAKDTAATVAKSGAKTFFKQLGEDFAQEAFEEGLAEILSPQFQKLTYNPDAKDATWQEVLYAATVGGVSGMIMTGSSAAVNTTQNFLSGKKSVESGTYRGVIESGKELAASERERDTGIDLMRSVKETYEQLAESLMKTNGITSTEALTERIKSGDITFNTKQKMLLGKLKGATTAARFHPYIERSAQGLIFDADRVAERYSSFGMTDANGKALTFTAEEILSGIDADLVAKAKAGTLTKEERRAFARSVRTALSENSILAKLATADAVGGIMMNTGKFTQAAMQDESLINREDLNYLIEHGKPEQIRSFADSLGIKDLRSATIDEVRAKIAEKRAGVAPKNSNSAADHSGGSSASLGISTNNSDTRYALSLDYYTKKEYNSYGWARANDVLNAAEYADFNSKFAGVVSGNIYAPRSKNGERMIATGVDGVNNKIVFCKGTIANPTITRVLEIDAYDETTLDGLRRNIYDAERRGIQPETSGIFRFHYPTNYGYDRYILRNSEGRGRNHSEFGTQRGTGSRKAPRLKEIYFGENGELIEKRYALAEGSETENGKAEEGNTSSDSTFASMTAEEIDAYARGNIEEYRQLNEPSKAAVRMTIREARASGLTDTQTLTYAKVAARSGLNIIFDAERALGDGSIKGNTIYINPKNSETRTREVILGHEMFHRLFATGGKKAMRLYREAWKLLPKEKRTEVRTRYQEFYIEQKADPFSTVMISEEEVAAAGAEEVFKIPDVWEYLLGEEPTLADKVVRFFYASARKYSGIDGMPAAARKFIRHYKKLFAELSERNQGTNALSLALEDQKAPVTRTNNENVQVTDDSPRITSGMSDDERYEVLKDKDITISAKTDRTKLESVMSKLDITESDLDLSKYGDKKRLFKKLGEEFGVFKQYNNPDTRVTFSFSKGGMSESVSKQRKGYMRLAKLLTCIDGVIENAVGIEVHNRNEEGYKVDTSLKNVYVLASAFVDGENIIPVKLEVKEFLDKENTLYVAIALESIKKNEIVKQEVATNGVARQYSPSFTISIADFLRKINPSDESFVKYIPDGFLNEAQLKAKSKAIEVDESKGKTFKQTSGDLRIALLSDEDLPSSDGGTRHALSEKKETETVSNPPEDASKKPSGITWPELAHHMNAVARAKGLPYDEYVHYLMYTKFEEAYPSKTFAKQIKTKSTKRVNLDNEKVYSMNAVMAAISKLSKNSLIDETFRRRFEKELFDVLNHCTTTGERDIATRALAEFYVESVVSSVEGIKKDIDSYCAQYNLLKTGVMNVEFTSEEITTLFKDYPRGVASKLLGRWGNKKRKKVSGTEEAKTHYTLSQFIEDVATNISELAYIKELAPITALNEINEAYVKANDAVNDTWVKSYEKIPQREYDTMVELVQNQIKEMYLNKGESPDFTKRLEATERQVQRWKLQYHKQKNKRQEAELGFKLKGLLLRQAQRMADLRHATYANATQNNNDLFKNSIEKLSKIQYRGNLNKQGARGIVGDLLAWYQKDNKLLEYEKEDAPGYYNQGIADMLQTIATGNGELTNTELSMMYDVMSYFIHFVENYGKIWRNGKMVEALPEAKRYIKTLRENEGIHPGIFMKLFGARFIKKYAEAFNDPASVVRMMDYYERGFFTETFEELREAAVNAG